ncbi:MAG: hypothetical protein NTW21_06730 [Verrucomicrobia bacterium]|nr:hypothetical protein [Verrucomicrobiota bacterium]
MNRLTRLDSVFTEAPVYFITAGTEKRRALLANMQRMRYSNSSVAMPGHVACWSGAMCSCRIICICLSACPPGVVGLSMWMKSLKNTLSKHWRASGIEAPHWQKGFFDHLIRSGESHAEKWKYVRENPVRVGLVEQAEAWPYGGTIQPDSWT